MELNMQNQESNKIYRIIGIIFAMVSGLMVLFLGLNYFNISPFNKTSSSIHNTIQLSPSAPTMTCANEQEKYTGFLGPIHTVGGVTVGTIRGTVKEVVYDNQKGIAVIALSSPDNHTSSDISLQDKKIRIANAMTHTYEDSLAVIQQGQQVILSYNCNPQTANNFLFVNISINASIDL